MKYFTLNLLARFRSDDDEIADRAHAEWESAIENYERHWQKIKSAFPAGVRRFEESHLCLHDAELISLARGKAPSDDRLLLILQTEPPSCDLVALWFSLTGKPVIEGDPAGSLWAYEEFDLDRNKKPAFEVLFNNDARIKLRFRDFQFWTGKTLLSPLRDLSQGVPTLLASTMGTGSPARAK
jgi:hypothetical protein